MVRSCFELLAEKLESPTPVGKGGQYDASTTICFCNHSRCNLRGNIVLDMMGASEYYWHTSDCEDDLCCLAGGYHDCDGEVVDCDCSILDRVLITSKESRK